MNRWDDLREEYWWVEERAEALWPPGWGALAAGAATGLVASTAILVGRAVLAGTACEALPPDAAAPFLWPVTSPAGCAEFWANRYQTLIVGVVATIAAAGTVYFTRKQIAQAQDQFITQLRVSTYFLRLEVERETERFLIATSTLIEDLGAFVQKPTQEHKAKVLGEIRGLLFNKETAAFERLRQHMTSKQLLTSDRFFSGLLATNDWPEHVWELREDRDRRAVKALNGKAGAFQHALREVRRTAEAWLGG